MDNWNRRNAPAAYGTEQIKRVIIGSGIDIESEVDSDYIIFCPFHNNYRSPAGEIDKNSGFFFCFSCQKVADLTEFVMHTTQRTYFEAVRFIKSKETETNLEMDIDRRLFVKPDYVPFDEILIKRLNNQALESPRALRYYSGRLITEESIKKFNLGYSEAQDMVTIPVASPDGVTVGFVGRSVEGKEFKNTPGLPKSKTLFNLHRVKTAGRVYVVESSFDAIRLDQCGFAAVATLGANVSNFQTDLLQKYFNEVYIVADNDEAGGNMKDKIIERLGSRANVIKIDKQYKDIGDMSDEAIKNIEETFDKTISSMLK